jgi:competence protein ComEC
LVSNDLVGSLSGTVQQFLNEPQSSLLNGILFGSQTKLPADLTQALRVTGTLHVVAVSGQNMSILAGFLGTVTRLLGWRFSLLLQGVGILGYIFLIGGGASVVRSGLMALIALFAEASGRQKDSGRALLLVASGMVVVHPQFLTDVGWQLSVLATAGIIWLEPLISERIAFLPQVLAASLSVSLAAQIFTWPVIVYQFGIFSAVALPANILIEWTVPWIMGLGILFLLFSQVGLGQILAWLVWVPLTYFINIVQTLAQWPLAIFSWTNFPIGLGLIYYSLLIWGIWFWYSKKAS